jgi:hypothetical protein
MKRFPILALLLLLLSACSGSATPTPLPIETAAPATSTAPARTPITPAAQPTVAPTLVSQPTPRPTGIIADIPAFQGIVLLLHISGGIAGFCDDLALFESGQAIYGPCGAASSTTLTEAQLAQIKSWQARFRSFEYKFQDNPGGPDNMTTSAALNGKGATNASEAEQKEIVNWARQLYAELSRKGRPTVAPTARPAQPIIINQPAQKTAITSPVTVSGEGAAFESELTVQVQDENGQTIGQATALIKADMGHVGPFTVQVDFPQPEKEQIGRVVVSSYSPRDGSVMAQSVVEVRLAAKISAAAVTPGAPLSSSTLKSFQGAGFSLAYPANAAIKSLAADRWQLVGPDIAIKSAQAAAWTGPAYSLSMTLYDNAQAAKSGDWARAYLLKSWQEAQQKKEPYAGPVDAAGKIVEGQVAEVRVGDKAAFQANFTAGDHTERVVYLSLKQKTLALSFGLYPVANYALAEAASDLYGLLLMQLVAPEAEGAPRTVAAAQGAREFTAPGFAIAWPSNATLQEIEAEHWELSGPEVSLRPQGADWEWKGPAYRLDLVLHNNPKGLDAAKWAEEFLLAEWKRAQEAQEPYTGPVGAQGKIRAEAAGPAQVGNAPGYRASWGAEDGASANGAHSVYYVNSAKAILAVHMDTLPSADYPAAPLADAIHALLIASLKTSK